MVPLDGAREVAIPSTGAGSRCARDGLRAVRGTVTGERTHKAPPDAERTALLPCNHPGSSDACDDATTVGTVVRSRTLRRRQDVDAKRGADGKVDGTRQPTISGLRLGLRRIG